MDHKQAPPLMTMLVGLAGTIGVDWLDLLGRIVVLTCAVIGAYISLSRYLWDLQARRRK